MATSTVVIFIWLLQWSLGAKYEGCKSPQYLEYGKSGVIDCFFHANFTSIFWYDSTNIVIDKPIVTLINSVKGGEGYISGKFDISSNGSLIITDVDVGHEKNFTVAKFVSLDLDGDPMTFVVSAVIIGVISDKCDSPQYLEYGRNGTVQCHFQTSFLSLLWYNSTDIVVDEPIVTYTQSVKSGRGFESGEFDIFSNGSLVIHEVGLVHEHNYTVAKFTGLNEEPTVFVVRVIVTVKSLLEGPVIDKCESNGTICFIELDGSSAVNCIVQGARPAVSLEWLTLTASGDNIISSKMSLISNNVTFTSRTVTSDAFAYTPVLSLLVCKADFAPGVLQRDKSFVLVQNSQRNLSSITHVMKYAPRGSTLVLYCTDSIIPQLQVVWKRSLSFSNQYQNLMFGVFMENHFETENNDHFQFGENGALILRQVDSQHDGFYGCIYGDGITNGLTKYKVVTYVNPVPAYPVVEECNYKSHCVLEVNRKGNLTCSLTGIRPEVNLQWRESNETSSGKITFFDHTTRVTESGGTFNISLTSSYSIISVAQVTVKCGVSGPRSDIFPSTFTTVSLRVVPAKEPDDSSVPTHNQGVRIDMLLMGMVVGFFCGMPLFISAYRCRKRNTRKEASFKTSTELCPIQTSLEEKEKLLQESQKKLEEEQKARTEKERELEERQSSHTKTAKELITIQADYDKISTQLSSTQKSLAEKEKLLQESQKKLEEEQKARAEKEKELAETESSHTKKVKELTTIQGDYDKISNQLSSAQSSLEEKEQLLQESQKKLEEEQKARAEKERELAETESSHIKTLMKLTKMLKCYTKLSSVQSSLEGKEKLLQESQKKLKEEQEGRTKTEREFAESQSSHIKTLREVTTKHVDCDKE